jgi:hypothetical protein
VSLDFFRIYRGLELDDSVQFLTGAVAPGTSADTIAAPVGSYYTDSTNGDLWTKVLTGAGVDKWRLQATQEFVQSFVTTGISWREPARVNDTAATTLPTGTPSNPIVVDGVSITDGQRVLFSAIVGGTGPNVYAYDQATGTFIEDLNPESAGDTLFIEAGTEAGTTWQYDGAAWQLIISGGGGGADEADIRAFIGKPTAGPVLPDYSSENYVTDGDSLTTAIGKLDAAVAASSLTTNETNVTTLTTVDSVVADVSEWDVFVKEVATPTRIWAGKVFAAHNGAAVDYTRFAVLKLNGNITGLNVTVALSGGNTLELQVQSTSAVDVKAARLATLA